MAVATIQHNRSIIRENAIDGVVDLSSYDLNKDVVSLDGSWQISWNNVLKPGQLNDELTTVLVPGEWKKENMPNGAGYATYKLKIILPDAAKSQTHALYFNRVGSAYKLFINGNEIGGNGIVGKTENQELPKRQTRLFHFDVKQNKSVELIVQVSNFAHKSGGIKTGVLFANSDKLQQTTFRFLLVELLSTCILLTVAVIYLSVFVFSADKQYLFFFLFLFFIALYVAGTGENIIGTIFPWIPWSVFMKIIHIFMILHLLFYNQLLNSMYSQERFTILFKGIQAVSLAYLFVVTFFSAKLYITFLPVFHLIMIATLLYWMILLARAALNKKAEASLVLVGVMFFAATAFIEILYVNSYAHNPRIVPIGLLMLVFSYIVVTTKAYANSNVLVKNAENEKHKAIAQAHVEKAAFLAEKERSSILHQTLTDSESISQVDKIRVNLRQISYIVSESGGSIVYGDKGERLFDLDLTLKRISEIFGTNNQLIRCSKAYIVNPSKARKVVRNKRRYELQFINSEIENVPVGNKYVTEIRSSIQVN